VPDKKSLNEYSSGSFMASLNRKNQFKTKLLLFIDGFFIYLPFFILSDE